MPIIESQYTKKPWYLINGHIETIIPSSFFKVEGVVYERERLELDDGDFLDLDWIHQGSKCLVVLSHGLEGSTERHYVKRPAKFFAENGYDVLAWNNRGCSGEMNRLKRLYHHGATEDIAAVIDSALAKGYEEIILVGYSMGGSMQQKYLGEREVDPRVKGAASFSVPCHLLDSAKVLTKGFCKVYERRFVNKLRRKILQKNEIIEMDTEGLDEISTLRAFDEKVTLKMFPGYASQDDFYNKNSSYYYLEGIKVPLLMVNAINDPMLTDRCYPVSLVRDNPNIYLEMPEYGGHVGFTMPSGEYSYMEHAALRFMKEVILR